MTQENAKPLKISFCTTCMGRLEHLKETLPQNLANNPGKNVEFVILAYGDRKTYNYVRAHYSDEIKSGKIKLAYTKQEYFQMSHAKNMAHRLATGDVLVNLDADNVTGKGFAGWLEEQYQLEPESLIGCTTLDKLINKVLLGGKIRSLDGRIALTSNLFSRLHGYDESFEGWGDEDGNLRDRARSSGATFIALPIEHYGSVIAHNNEERLRNMSDIGKSVGQQKLSVPPNRVKTVQRVLGINKIDLTILKSANPDGNFGCGEVTVLNRDSMTETHLTLTPQPHPEWVASYAPSKVAEVTARRATARRTDYLSYGME